MRNRSKLLAFAIALSSVAGQGIPVLANESDVTIEPADVTKGELENKVSETYKEVLNDLGDKKKH